MPHGDNHGGETRNIVAAAGSRQTHRRTAGIADARAVEIAVLIDLCAA